jgi:sugar lactone lactonase YvrE
MKKSACMILAAMILFSLTTSVSAGSNAVEDYSGNGIQGYLNGGSPEAKFNQPYGIAMDKDGGLLIVDSYNNMIRKVKDGKVTDIAGSCSIKDSNGDPAVGFADGDTAKALFNHPRDASFDSKGNIYVTDTGNNVIRKIANGKVTTFAGTLTQGYQDGRANEAKFNLPTGIALDKEDNIYVADTLNNVIRKITSKGEVSTFAGMHSPAGGFMDGFSNHTLFNEPSDIKIDKNGVLYVLDSGNQLVRKIENGQVSTVAGLKDKINPDTGYVDGKYADGQKSKAGFNFPKGLDIADDGTIFIADTWNHRIRVIRTDGNVGTIAGSGIPGKKDDPLPQTEFNNPVDILYRGGSLYISDMSNNCIRTMKFEPGKLPDITDKSEIINGIGFKPKSDEIQVWFDKQIVNFPDVKPYQTNGKTYVPLRFIFEKWGAKVNYLPGGQVEVTKGRFYKVFTFGKDPLIVKNNRTMIDAVNLSEITGFYIEKVDQYNAVVIAP